MASGEGDSSEPLTFDKIDQQGLGVLRLSPEALDDLTFRQYDNALKGYYKSQELLDRSEWIRCRWQTTLLLNIQMEKKNRVKQKDLIEFEWERANRKVLSPEEKKEIQNRLKEF